MLGLRDYQSSDEEEPPEAADGVTAVQHNSNNNGTQHENTTTSSSSAPPSAPASPYSANRQLIHSLTLPTIPNVVIPPSPPGSPPASASAKFRRFLDLKSQHVHFNVKLATSSQLKNPSLFQNLTAFAGISDNHDQYASTLPPSLAAVPVAGFPPSAYWQHLNKSQHESWKKKELTKTRAKRDAVEFVAAASPQSSQNSTPHALPPARPLPPKTSASERVMAGLSRERSNSPHSSGNLSHRPSRYDDKHKDRKHKSNGPRSPKRRRER